MVNSVVELNKAQKAAVNHGEGPMIVIAGAGTGKTRVITERICRLMREKKAKAEEILAVTFTEKAAGEMLDRIDKTMPFGYGDLWVMTFHGLCDRILKESAIHIGINPGYELLTYPGQIALLRQNLFKKFDLEYFRPLNNPYRFLDALIKHVSRLQDEDVSPKEYKEFAKKCMADAKKAKGEEAEIELLNAKKTVELSNFYQTYQDLKRDCNKMDFGDLIYNTLTLFRQRPNVLAEYQKRFKYVLVDEFQDTNFTQNEIAIMLSSPQNNIMVVGDDDQAIYRFRGASISNILQFKERFPKAKEAILTENYRSLQEILDSAYEVITHNNPYRLEVKEGVDKRLTSMCDAAAAGKTSRKEKRKAEKKAKENEKSLSLFGNVREVGGKEADAACGGDVKFSGEPVEIFRFQREFDEADFVAQKIMELAGYEMHESKDTKMEIRMKEGEGVPFEEIAVLVRAHSHLAPIVDRLRFYGVPYQFAGNSDLFNRPVVKDMMALLRLLEDPEDNLSAYRVVSFEGFELSQKTLASLTRQCKYSGESLFSVVRGFVTRKGTEGHKLDGEGYVVENAPLTPNLAKPAPGPVKNSVTGDKNKGFERLKALFGMVDILSTEKIWKGGVSIVLFNLLKQIDYITVLEIEKGDQAGLASLYEFLNLVKNFESEESPSLSEVLEFLENIESLGGVDQGDIDIVPRKGVQLMTVHGAKGLEFAAVVIPSLVRDRFPSRKMYDPIPIPDEVIKEVLPEDDPHLQEERRLFYVGATRAKKKLILTFSDYYSEGKQLRQPSIFLSELLGEGGSAKLKAMEYGKVADALGMEPTIKADDDRIAGKGAKAEPAFFVPKQVSFSQLDVYNKCPTQYYFSYVLGLRAPASAVLSFGNTVHATLKKFYELHRLFVLGKAKKPSLDDLLSQYEESWVSAGYRNKRYEEKRRESGRRALTEYYNRMYKTDERPVKLEEGFRAQFGDVLVVGKVDRVDFSGESAGKTGQKTGPTEVKIVDYKTGADKEKIEEHEKLQLAIYAYAISQRWGWKIGKMSIVRVEGGREIEMKWDEKWLDKAKEFVLNTVRQIGTKGFPARPGFICEYCDYRNICNWAKR